VTIKIEKNVYDKPEHSDGQRILVMKFWPRGVSKDMVDEWMKDLGTGGELIKKWKSGKVSWTDFKQEYKKSLRGKTEMLKDLARKSENGNITLLCTDKDSNRCHRTILANEIKKFEWEKNLQLERL
jgi:uncharacterized protein YeaO (DUF488 family)